MIKTQLPDATLSKFSIPGTSFFVTKQERPSRLHRPVFRFSIRLELDCDWLQPAMLTLHLLRDVSACFDSGIVKNILECKQESGGDDRLGDLGDNT
jgi:hypothetical protein